MGYIEEMRRLIGHRPLILAGAAVILIDPDGQILMNLRTDNHTWGLPGGAMELGETLEETAMRETFEETGLTVDSMELLDVFSGPEKGYTYPNGDVTYNVVAIYQSRAYHGELITSNEESACLRFFAPNEIDLAQVSPPQRPVLRAWLTHVLAPLPRLSSATPPG